MAISLAFDVLTFDIHEVPRWQRVEGGAAASLVMTTDGFSDFWNFGFFRRKDYQFTFEVKEESNEFIPVVLTCKDHSKVINTTKITFF